MATSVVIMVFTNDDLLMQYRYGKIDWMLDKTECKQGDEVKLIMSNINNSLFPNPKSPIKKEEVMWKMVKQCENPNFGNDNKPNVVLGTMEADFSGTQTGRKLFEYQNYTWLIPTKKDEKGKNIEPGIYCIYCRVFDLKGMILPESDMVPLSRKLRIVANK